MILWTPRLASESPAEGCSVTSLPFQIQQELETSQSVLLFTLLPWSDDFHAQPEIRSQDLCHLDLGKSLVRDSVLLRDQGLHHQRGHTQEHCLFSLLFSAPRWENRGPGSQHELRHIGRDPCAQSGRQDSDFLPHMTQPVTSSNLCLWGFEDFPFHHPFSSLHYLFPVMMQHTQSRPLLWPSPMYILHILN